jgi:DNA-3-methyladenine glycosylase II
MEHTQVNVRGNLFQRWLLLNMSSQEADGFGDALIVVVKCCHDAVSMSLVDRAVEPDLAEMIITLDNTAHKKALRHLRKHDKKLSAVIARTRACELSPRPHLDLFGTLAHAIVGQQLSVKAAATIYARFCDLLGAADGQPHPGQLQGITIEHLRATGLSQAKALAVLDLAAKIDSGQVLAPAELESLDDESVIQNLIQVRGVGRWTAEMFLMFQMGRADVLPVDDLGIRKGFMQVYGLDTMPDKKWMMEWARCWQPYRSVASWYLWRAVE